LQPFSGAITAGATVIGLRLSWLSIQIRRTAMVRIDRLTQAVFRLILMPHEDSEDRIDATAFYIGLGDQFDDDRRRVRASASAFRPTIRPTSDGVSARTISADSRSPLEPKATLLQSALAAFVRTGWCGPSHAGTNPRLRSSYPFASRTEPAAPFRLHGEVCNARLVRKRVSLRRKTQLVVMD
jgi:hypothetical protein